MRVMAEDGRTEANASSSAISRVDDFIDMLAHRQSWISGADLEASDRAGSKHAVADNFPLSASTVNPGGIEAAGPNGAVH